MSGLIQPKVFRLARQYDDINPKPVIEREMRKRLALDAGEAAFTAPIVWRHLVRFPDDLESPLVWFWEVTIEVEERS